MSQASLDELDARLRAAIRAEPRIVAALAYGSRTRIPGGTHQDDEYSDLEYYVYPHPGTELEPAELIETVTSVALAVVNPFGTPNFVTPELHRIELHVASLDQLSDLLEWSTASSDPARMLVKDGGDMLIRLLTRLTGQPDWCPKAAQTTFDQVLNALVAVRGSLSRGERLRAYECLTSWGAVGGLVRLARHAEAVAQPSAATRRAEHDLSADMLKRIEPCAAGMDGLEDGWQQAVTLGAELARKLELDERLTLLAALKPSASPPLRHLPVEFGALPTGDAQGLPVGPCPVPRQKYDLISVPAVMADLALNGLQHGMHLAPDGHRPLQIGG